MEVCKKYFPPQPRQVRTARRVLRGLSAASPCCDIRAGRTPWGSNALAKKFQFLRRRPVAVLVRPNLDRRRGQERAARWPTSQSRHVRAARRVLRRRSEESPRGETCAGRATRGLNALAVIFRGPCCRPVAVLVRLSFGRRRGDGARRALSHNNHAESALRGACSAVRRPLLHGAIRARENARHGI